MDAVLSQLTNAQNISARTHQQALSAWLFLYQQVLGIALPWMSDLTRPKQPHRPPFM